MYEWCPLLSAIYKHTLDTINFIIYYIILFYSLDKDFLEVTLGLENYKDMMHTVFNALTCNNY